MAQFIFIFFLIGQINMKKENKLFANFIYNNRIYWRLSATFLVLLLIMSVAYIYTTTYCTATYFEHTNQKVNVNLAQNIADHYMFYKNSQLDEAQANDVFTHIAVVNPNVEPYILDTTGRIIRKCHSNKIIVHEAINLNPIKHYLANEETLVRGDDPRQLFGTKTFSVAELKNEGKGKVMGYFYIILGNEEIDNIADPLLTDYILQIGMESILITLIGALIIGLLVIWLLTRNLSKIIQTVQQFEAGNLHARVPLNSMGELTPMANTFNKMADTIVKNIEELQAVDKLRKELIANVSHDLRTPLAIIHGYIETLLMKANTLTTDAQKRYMTIILNSTENLKKLVEELFELSKLETRQVKTNEEPFFLSELVQDIYQKYQLLAQEKNIHLHPILIQNQALVKGDIAMIERVLQNLIDNALKYTPPKGTISIELKGDGKYLEFSITNTGIGIPASELPQIFNRYYKVNSTSNNSYKGAGLGLAIVKNILDIHNTSIQVRSEMNEFTQFSFKLPVYQV